MRLIKECLAQGVADHNKKTCPHEGCQVLDMGKIREPKYCSDGNLVGVGDFVFKTPRRV